MMCWVCFVFLHLCSVVFTSMGFICILSTYAVSLLFRMTLIHTDWHTAGGWRLVERSQIGCIREWMWSWRTRHSTSHCAERLEERERNAPALPESRKQKRCRCAGWWIFTPDRRWQRAATAALFKAVVTWDFCLGKYNLCGLTQNNPTENQTLFSWTLPYT